MTSTKVIKRLATMQPAVFGTYTLKPNRCILATAVGIKALQAFGIEGRPLSVKMDRVNKSWVRWVNLGKLGGPDAAVSLGAWAVSAGYPPGTPGLPDHAGNDGMWDGHLVVEVRAMRLLIDLDTQGFSRPQKNMPMPDAAVFSNWDGIAAQYDTPDGGLIRYEAKRDDIGYQVARDWADTERNQAMVDRVVRAIRKGSVR